MQTQTEGQKGRLPARLPRWGGRSGSEAPPPTFVAAEPWWLPVFSSAGAGAVRLVVIVELVGGPVGAVTVAVAHLELLCQKLLWSCGRCSGRLDGVLLRTISVLLELRGGDCPSDGHDPCSRTAAVEGRPNGTEYRVN